MEEKDHADPMQAGTVADLPHQRWAAPGAIFAGNVVSALSPGEFYIVPDRDCACICCSKPKLGTQPKGPESFSGLKILEAMLHNLSISLSRFPRAKHKYKLWDVIACPVEIHGKVSYEWERGVVIELLGRKSLLVYLIDSGTRVKVRASNCGSLPQKYSKVPPMAYKCILFGVIPISDVWCSRATATFKKLVDHDIVLVEIKRSPAKLVPASSFLLDPPCYEVSLRVPDREDTRVPCLRTGTEDADVLSELRQHSDQKMKRFVDVAGELAATFNAILINPFPFRPAIKKHGVISHDLVPLLDPWPEVMTQCPPEVLEKETKRLTLELMNMRRTKYSGKESKEFRLVQEIKDPELLVPAFGETDE